MTGTARRRAVLIAGPTASGKSALALAMARDLGSIIVNTDAMQVYADLSILTARPSQEDLIVAPHRLYGTIDPAVRFSTGDWYSAVAALIDEVAPDVPLIFVGGTGLYFEALTNGIAEVPAVPAAVVEAISAEVIPLDAEGRGKLIAARDPEMARRLRAPDPQRVIRALSVLEATGRSLAHFQDAVRLGLLDGFSVERMVLAPDRDILRQRIAERFAKMVGQGAAGEVERLVARSLDPSLPVMKAIGVREIAAMLRGELTRDTAIDRAVTATRQFAKRQGTWFRNRMADWPRRHSTAD